MLIPFFDFLAKNWFALAHLINPWQSKRASLLASLVALRSLLAFEDVVRLLRPSSQSNMLEFIATLVAFELAWFVANIVATEPARSRDSSRYSFAILIALDKMSSSDPRRRQLARLRALSRSIVLDRVRDRGIRSRSSSRSTKVVMRLSSQLTCSFASIVAIERT